MSSGTFVIKLHMLMLVNGKSNNAIGKTDEYYKKVKETLNKKELFDLPKQLPMEKLVELYGIQKNGNIQNAYQCLSPIIVKKLCSIYDLNSKKTV
jgi:hypothetical protein